MSTVLLLKMGVSGINAIDSHLVAAGPKLTAAHGFATSLLLKLPYQLSPTEASEKLVGFIYVHHNMNLHAMLEPKYNRRYWPQQRRGAFAFSKNDYVGNSISQGLQPTMSADINVTLIIQYKNITIEAETVNLYLPSMRFAGGKITKHSCHTYENTHDALNAIPSGFVVIDRRDLMENDTTINVTTNILTRRPNPQYKPQGTDLETYSFMALANMGHALLYEPREQAGSLQGYRHAVSEPLIGAVQYISKNRGQLNVENLLFCSRYDTEQRYWVLEQPLLNSNITTDEDEFVGDLTA